MGVAIQLILVALTSQFILTSANPIIEDWRLTIGALYGQNGNSLKPSKVSELLERANVAYQKLDVDYKKDKKVQKAGNEVADLLQVNSIIGKKCEYQSFKFIQSLIELHSHHIQQIIPYLKQKQREHSIKCKERYELEVRKAVDSLEPEIRRDAKLLWQFIQSDRKSNEKFNSISHFIGVLNFVEATNGLFEPNIERSRFEKIMRSGVEKVCDPINDIVKPISVQFSIVKSNPKTIDYLDSSIDSWSALGDACWKIKRDFGNIVASSYKTFVAHQR